MKRKLRPPLEGKVTRSVTFLRKNIIASPFFTLPCWKPDGNKSLIRVKSENVLSLCFLILCCQQYRGIY